MTDVTGVDFVAIMTKDHDAAVKFYGETLGLPFVKQWGTMPGSEFQAGNLTLAVMQPDAFGFEWRAERDRDRAAGRRRRGHAGEAAGRGRRVPRRHPSTAASATRRSSPTRTATR